MVKPSLEAFLIPWLTHGLWDINHKKKNSSQEVRLCKPQRVLSEFPDSANGQPLNFWGLHNLVGKINFKLLFHDRLAE